MFKSKQEVTSRGGRVTVQHGSKSLLLDVFTDVNGQPAYRVYVNNTPVHSGVFEVNRPQRWVRLFEDKDAEKPWCVAFMYANGNEALLSAEGDFLSADMLAKNLAKRHGLMLENLCAERSPASA